ncbi:hypothetical protein [Vibrio sonorensis]|uniref:hypothetical protein n=1 Tax=Vibrio sonorensis TaxID=1004316 RepID=UPI0015862C89|nr:hypothetical protein [Vibrio sonorensis]
MVNIIKQLVSNTRAQWAAFIIREFSLDRRHVWRALGYSSEHEMRRDLYLYDESI